MRVEKPVQFGDGRQVVVREMTLGEIRAWLKQASTVTAVDTVDALLFDEFRPTDLQVMVAAGTDLDSLTARELRLVHEAAKEVNPDFFGLLAKAVEQGRQMLASALNNPPSP